MLIFHYYRNIVKDQPILLNQLLAKKAFRTPQFGHSIKEGAGLFTIKE